MYKCTCTNNTSTTLKFFYIACICSIILYGWSLQAGNSDWYWIWRTYCVKMAYLMQLLQLWSGPPNPSLVHTLHTYTPCICIIMQFEHNMLLRTFTYMYIVHMHSEHSWWAWLHWPKYTTRDVCRLCYLILSTLMPVFLPNATDLLRYNSLRCLDLHIWWFLCPRQMMTTMMTTEPIALPLAYACWVFSMVSALTVLLHMNNYVHDCHLPADHENSIGKKPSIVHCTNQCLAVSFICRIFRRTVS